MDAPLAAVYLRRSRTLPSTCHRRSHCPGQRTTSPPFSAFSSLNSRPLGYSPTPHPTQQPNRASGQRTVAESLVALRGVSLVLLVLVPLCVGVRRKVVSLIKESNHTTNQEHTSVVSAANPWLCQLVRKSCPLLRHPVHMPLRQRDRTRCLDLGIVRSPCRALHLVSPGLR